MRYALIGEAMCWTWQTWTQVATVNVAATLRSWNASQSSSTNATAARIGRTIFFLLGKVPLPGRQPTHVTGPDRHGWSRV